MIQQLREALPGEATHLVLIYDHDAIFSAAVTQAIANLGVSPERTAFRSPWQNGTAERFVGTVRRELLDHVVVLGEDHLRRLLREYVEYYQQDRVHTVLMDSPLGRPAQRRPSPRARIVGWPRVGGLHHRSAWSQAPRSGATRPKIWTSHECG